MKKNDLIKLLESIQGNPEIFVWNGFVSDFMPLENRFVEEILVKEQESFILETLKWEYCVHNKTTEIPTEVLEDLESTAKRLYKESEWDIPNSFVTEENFERWYGKKSKHKRIVSLVPKLTGKTYQDRLGEIDY